MERARKEYEAANAEFWRISADIPSGIPPPDGTQRIHNAARNQNLTRHQLAMAIERLNDFLGDGRIPEELQSDESKSSGQHG